MARVPSGLPRRRAGVVQQIEQVLANARIHRIVELGPLLLGVIVAALLVITPTIGRDPMLTIGVGIPLMLGVALMFAAGVAIRRTTGLMVTTRRLFADTGIIRPNSMEIRLDQVESLTISRSLGGRLFGYATVVVRDVDGIQLRVHYVANHPEFRDVLKTP